MQAWVTPVSGLDALRLTYNGMRNRWRNLIPGTMLFLDKEINLRELLATKQKSTITLLACLNSVKIGVGSFNTGTQYLVYRYQQSESDSGSKLNWNFVRLVEME